MSKHPRTVRPRQVLTLVCLVTMLSVLAGCELPRPRPRATPTPVTAASPALPQFSTAPANVIGDRPDVVRGEIIVKLEEVPAEPTLRAVPQAGGVVTTGLPGIDQLNQQFGVTAFDPLLQPVADASSQEVRGLAQAQPELAGLYVVTFDQQYDPYQVAAAYDGVPEVVYAEPNFYAYASGEPVRPLAFTPNDPYFRYQWHLPLIQAQQAWDMSTGQGVLVAVLDTGIAYEDFDTFRRAPDLASTRFTPGYDFVNNDAHANDDEGHGTHVAGTLAQSTNNAQGTSGVAFSATLMPVKVLNNQGQGSYDVVAQGIIYAANRGVRVINISLSGRSGSTALSEAVSYAARRGVLLVAAAGNSGGQVEYPAAYADVLAVGSVGSNARRVSYSNFGAALDLVAPGGDTDVDLNRDGFPDGVLQQTFRGNPTSFGFYYYEGTSMASPHVAGAAALLFARNPGLNAGQVRRALEISASDQGAAGRDDEYGNGLLQAANALAVIVGPPTSTPTPTRSPTPTPSRTPTGPTPTPTPTRPSPPTLTPTPTGTLPPTMQNILANGDFETSGGWVFSLTDYPAGYSSDVVHGGARAARLGIVDGVDRYSYSSVWQRVSIPDGARRATLTYWVYPLSQDVYPQDKQMVLILDRRFRVVRTVDETLADSRRWIQRSYDMTPFAGRTVIVYFGVYNGGRSGRPSRMYVDDVSLVVER